MKKGFNDGLKLSKNFADSLVSNFSKVASGSISLSKGVGNVANSFKAMMANPYAAAFAVLAGSIKAVTEALGKSAAGQRILTAVSGVLEGVMVSLSNVVEGLGDLLVNIWNNPKKVLKDFGKYLKDLVMRPVNSLLDGVGYLGSAIKKLFKGDVNGAWADAKKGAKDFGKAILYSNPAFVAVEQSVKGVNNAINKVNKNIKTSISLKQREHDLYVAESKWITKRGELEARIADNKRELRKDGLTMVEYAKIEKALFDDIHELNKGNSYLQKEQLSILDAKQNLGANTKEDDRERAELANQINLQSKAHNNKLRETKVWLDGIKKTATKYTAELDKANEELEEANEILSKGLTTKTKNVKVGVDFDIDTSKLDANTKEIIDRYNSEADALKASEDKKKKLRYDGFEFAKNMYGQFAEIEQNYYDSKKQKIDDEAAKEIEAVQNSSMNEEQKAASIQNIQTKAELEKRKIERKAAIAKKRNALIEIAINTAIGVSKAYGQTGIFGIAASIPIIAMGAAQAAVVLSQPIPKLAKGGIVYGDSIVNVGEYANAKSNPEVIAPLDKLKSLIGDRGSRIIQVMMDSKVVAEAVEYQNYIKNR
ncbi:hypothetical protein [uncultured Carboxylicivirga sp.]|nr:hypothetical protein [uncultured Carboxylicivirga sp.]TRX71504.1 hypothetical protein FNN09_05915 [Carboxylicivirga sp. M1479]